MHCPNCGEGNSTDQNFCRVCGMNLESISKALNEHLSTIKPDKLEKQAQDRALLLQMYRVLMSGIFVVILGVVILAAGKGYEFAGLIGGLIALAGMLITVYGVLSPIKAIALPPPSSNRHEPKILESATTTELYLPSEEAIHLLQQIPSATEQTTDLLAVETKKTSGNIG